MLNFAQIPILGSRVFDADYQAILDQATSLGYTLPELTVQIAQNEFLQLMKLNGYWSKLDLFYLFRTGDSGLSDFATINWKAPSSFQLTKVNSPTFDANGFVGNSTSSYLDCHYNPSTNATNYSTNQAAAFAYIVTAGSPQDNTNPLWGLSNALGNIIGMGANTVSQRMTDSANLAAAVDLTGTGYKAASRENDADNVNFYNETTKSTRVSSSNPSGASDNLTIMRANAQYGNAKTAMFGFGGMLVETEHNQLRLDYLTYNAAL